MRVEEIKIFLTDLASVRKVSASTQNQALNAIVFLYREVLEIVLEDFSNFLRAKKAQFLPVVLSQEELSKILESMSGRYLLMTSLLYGCGLRLNECLELRIKDIDFDCRVIWIRQEKGKKDRALSFP